MRGPTLRLALAALLVPAPFPLLAAPPLRLDPRLTVAQRAPAPPVPQAPAAPMLRLRPSTTLFSAPARAPALADGRTTEPVIVAITVNQVDKGERYARLGADGAFYLKREDLRAIASVPETIPGIAIDAEEFVDLRMVPGLVVRFDEKLLALALTFPPEHFPRQVFDISSHRAPAELDDAPTSALLSYRAGHFGSEGSSGTTSLALDAAVNWNRWLLRNRTFHARSGDATVSSRIETQLIRDDLDNLRRVTIGDFITPSVTLGSTVPLAGLSFAKAYLLSPYLVRYPTVGYEGIAATPSQVDFYVGNTLVLRQQIAPGPFDIRNFSFYGGRRDVRVVIRDAAGFEQTVAHPFYFATRGLAAGLHDYSYQVGWLRQDPTATRDAYGKPAFSAFHQYGFTDTWTLGLRTEGSARMVNGGGDVFYRNEHLGLFSLHAAASHDRDRGARGSAFSLTHGFIKGDFSSYLVWQRYSEDYAVLHTQAAPLLPKRDFSVSLGYNTWLGSLGLAYTRLELHDGAPARRSANLSWSRPLTPRLTLTSYVRQQWGELRDTQLYVGLQYLPTQERNLNLSYLRDRAGNRTTSATFSTAIPQGEGVAYALGLQRQQTPEGSATVASPRVHWNARYATVAAEATHVRGGRGGDSISYNLALDGSLVAAGGLVDITRTVADGFAIVQTTPPMAGVRVYGNSQEVGRTDARGRALITQVPSYSTNYASIQDRDVPIEYVIDKVQQSFAVPMRGGRVVPFDLALRRSFSGVFFRGTGAARSPLVYQLVVVETPAGPVELPTTEAGEFYAENLPAGRLRAHYIHNGRRCDFILAVPASADTMVSLGEVPTCDARP